MDADATSELHKRGVSATDDKYKFVWFQVSNSGFHFNFVISKNSTSFK